MAERRLYELEHLLDQAEERLATSASRSDQHLEESSLDEIDPAGPIEVDLTTGQERLWYLEQIDQDPVTFIRPVALRLLGELRVDLLEEALNHLVGRHELLRARFSSRAGRPVLAIMPRARLNLRIQDARNVDADMLRAALDDPLMQVDPAQAPMAAARLYRSNPDESVLLLTFHHTIMDAWSEEVIRADLASIYSDLSRGGPVRLTPLRIQPKDLAAEQRRRVDSGEFEAAVRRIGGKVPPENDPLDLPPDRTRATTRSHRGDAVLGHIDVDLVDRLTDFARGRGATLYMALVSAYAIVLSRWTGKTTFAVGCPTAGRTSKDTESTVGFLVNRVLINIQLSAGQRFIDVLDCVRDETLDALASADVPFELVLDAVAPAGEAHRSPLIQTTFNLETVPVRACPDRPVRFETVFVPHHVAPFDLSVETRPRDGGLDMSFVYAVELLEADSIHEMARQFETVLRSICADPEQPVDRLDLMSGDRRAAILNEWSWGGRLDCDDVSMVEAFEQTVDRYPQASAVECRGRSLTYRDLDRAANRLAHYLLDLGVEPGDRIAFSLERSVDLVVTILAILKTGAAYVPLEPIQPEARRRVLIEQTASSILITTSRLVGGFRSGDLRVIELDADAEQIAQRSPQRPEIEISPSALAYIVHTSGSTGQPKGVPCTHRSVVRFIRAVRTGDVGPDQRHLWISSPGFDMTNYQLYGALFNGGVCIVSWEDRPTPTEIGRTIDECRVTSVRTTASFFNLLIDEVPERLGGLGTLSAGGESMSVEHARRAKRLLPGCRISNWYGPTETVSSATEFELLEFPDMRAVSIPVGRPQPGRSVYILDHRLQPVPPCAAGDIYIGGTIIAEGYLDNPDATAASFLEDPFSDQPAALMYRTGDRGRWLPDGNIEFLGRADRQIQIRGFRIEPGEVESAISQIPGVADVAVVPVEIGQGGLNLAAFVRPGPGVELSEDVCQRFLAERVPHHLVPPVWSFVPTMPITTSGKTDYKELASQAPSPATAPGQSRPPETETELRLAEIWREVLGVSDPGAEDDFFRSGGHSLLAAKLYVRIERAFGIEVPIATLFSAPTIETLAKLLDDETERARWPSLVPIRTEGRKPAFFLVAQGNIVGFENVAHKLEERAFYVFHHPAVHRGPLLDISVEEIAEYFLRELRKVQKRGPYLLGGWCAGSAVAYEMARRLRADGNDVPLLAIMDSIRPPGAVSANGTLIDPLLNERAPAKRSSDRPPLVVRLFRRYVRSTRRMLMSEHRRKTRKIREAMVGARSRYRPAIYDGPITLFQANPAHDRVAQLQALWPEVTTGSFRKYRLDCAHSDVWKPGNAAQTAAALSEEIDRVLTDGT